MGDLLRDASQKKPDYKTIDEVLGSTSNNKSRYAEF